jgi:hypothetical protein
MNAMTTGSAQAQPNEHGVTWSTSRNGKLDIAVSADHGTPLPHQVDVWTIYHGTHDVGPHSRRFTGPNREADARAYANKLWADGA